MSCQESLQGRRQAGGLHGALSMTAWSGFDEFWKTCVNQPGRQSGMPQGPQVSAFGISICICCTQLKCMFFRIDPPADENHAGSGHLLFVFCFICLFIWPVIRDVWSPSEGFELRVKMPVESISSQQALQSSLTGCRWRSLDTWTHRWLTWSEAWWKRSGKSQSPSPKTSLNSVKRKRRS